LVIALSKQCPNCSQPVLADDESCWQCGWPLKGKEPSVPVTVNDNDVSLAAALGNPVDLSAAAAQTVPAFAVYASLTLLFTLLALLLMNQLGQQPLLQINNSGRPGEWTAITSANRQFVLDLPETWQGYDQGDPALSPGWQTLVSQTSPLQAGLAPLGDLVRDGEILFFAIPEKSAGIGSAKEWLLLLRSPSLRQLSPNQAIKQAVASAVNILEAEYVDNFEKSHTSLVTEQERSTGLPLRCRQILVSGDQTGWLLAVCTNEAIYTRQATTYKYILDSFQLLPQ